jgi:hypothetical protein
MSVEQASALELSKLLQETNKIFHPNESDTRNPYRNMKNWIGFQQIMKRNALYFPHYLTLNDPFECVANIHYTSDIDDEILQKHYEKNLQHMHLIATFHQFKQKILEHVQGKKKHVYAPHITKHPLPFGIISLSEDPTNIQMWSYYANNHKGVCVIFEMDWGYILKMLKSKNPNISNESILEELEQGGFQFSILGGENESINFGLQKVQYSPSIADYPANDFYKAFFNEEDKKRLSWFLTERKHSNWSHEAEWRLVCFNQYSSAADHLMPFNELKFIKPCGVIMGCQMDPQIKELIRIHFHEQYPLFELNPSLENGALSYALTPNKLDIITKLSESTLLLKK